MGSNVYLLFQDVKGCHHSLYYSGRNTKNDDPSVVEAKNWAISGDRFIGSLGQWHNLIRMFKIYTLGFKEVVAIFQLDVIKM